jgi:PGF-CTERM protein
MTNFTRNLCLFALLIAILVVAPVSAGVQVSGTVKYMKEVAPGTTVNFPIILTTGSGDAVADYTITVLGFGNDKNGNYVTIPVESDTGEHTARPYISIDKDVVTLKPGTSETVMVTVKVPADATGGLYALIAIQKSGQTGMVRTAINVPVMITVKGTEIDERGVIVEITADVTEDPVKVTTSFTNVGNHHYYGAKNQIIIYNSDKQEVWNSTTNPLAPAIVPIGNVQFTQSVNTQLPAGTYEIRSIVRYQNDTAIYTSTDFFTTTTDKVKGTPYTVVKATTTKKAPGFGVGVVIIGLVGVSIVIIRRKVWLKK